jgi:pimeloyl-ACP methyl ester carboxylesterase
MRAARTLAPVLLALLAACGGSPTDDAVYPACSEAAQQCLDSLPVGQDLALPFYRNFSLTAPNPAITQAVIVVHGLGRDANNYFYTMATAVDQAGLGGTTLVVAPHFQCGDDQPPSGQVYWQCSGPNWAHGFRDANGAPTPIYSYAVMDQLVTALADKTTFPNLTQVTVTGLSAGGQFTQRYAATNPIDPVTGIALRYLVLSPSSYVYLDATRPALGATCSVDGGCDAPFAPLSNEAGCSDYDSYYYGLENRSGYVAVPSATQVQTQFVARKVAYMVGDEDTLANAAGTHMDTSCEANAQGVDRLARALAFWNEVTQVYQAPHTLTVVPGCMHSRTCMYFSPEVRAALFPPDAG